MRFTHACAAVVAISALSGSAHAATIVQNFSLASTTAGTIATFNSALGVLDSVVISGSAQGFAEVSSQEVGYPAQGTYGLLMGSGTNYESIFAIAMSGTVSPGPPPSCAVSGTTTTTHTTNLDRFVDRGTLTLRSGGSACGGIRPYAFGSGTITYNYTPGSSTPVVPEPATWAMMIGGFGLVGGAMRRKRPSRAAQAA